MAGEWMFMHPLLKPVALVWGRLELPSWRGVLNRVAGWDHLESGPRKRIKGKLHGFWMDLDLSDWSDRWVYFLGRYYEAHTQLLFQKVLRPGDTFVDIGANIGMTTLCAAAQVRPGGRIISFEPNPRVFERLSGHVAANGLEELVDLRTCGLADAAADLELRVPQHTGQGSFANVHGQMATTAHRVPVRVGDEQLADLPDSPTFIKIDVEGYECRVLRGLRRTLDRLHPAVLTEASPDLLKGAGSSLDELFATMRERGYAAHYVDYRTKLAGWPGRLILRRIDHPEPGGSDDILWTHPISPFHGRISGMLS